MTRQTLLPPNRTRFEEAMDLTGARTDHLLVELRKLVKPYQIPSLTIHQFLQTDQSAGSAQSF